MECLNCNETMQTINYEGAEIDRCPDQHGLWLDGNELERIQITMEEYESDVRIEADKPIDFFQEKKCPRCRTPLKDTEYESIPLDICPSCNGYWCDEGELTEVIQSRETIFSQDVHPEIKANVGNPNKQRTSHVELLPCAICGTNMQHIN